ncbi:hypothetical protein J2S43_001510 [Catenuloplanes nepalensis]|uniref:Luciferase-like monooxygenase n=1 Tax=Catenuloplanes nepalensis TaxID=587533 RepID=A0ABT9MNH1_9ACTN|nr:hypothetical protein [Catenuloplanes nepalensis]MDP9792998.1 hypothetical protein [Catenuloplanes nepalensis]
MDAPTMRGAALMAGGPEQLTEKILDRHEVLGADRFFAQADFGGLPRERVGESSTRFAAEVVPAVRSATRQPVWPAAARAMGTLSAPY